MGNRVPVVFDARSTDTEDPGRGFSCPNNPHPFTLPEDVWWFTCGIDRMFPSPVSGLDPPSFHPSFLEADTPLVGTDRQSREGS